MISREELTRVAKNTGLNLYQQEKEYLLKLFLYNYYDKFDSAIFKGGTALRFVYGLDRFSEDLDFNISDPEQFQKEVREVLKSIVRLGIESYFIKEELFEESYTCEIGFHGPLHEGSGQTRNKFRIDAGYREKMARKPVWRLISSEYPETRSKYLVLLMDAEEMLCEKIRALFTRRKGRDLYDVWFMLNSEINIDGELLAQKIEGGRLRAEEMVSAEEYERDMKHLVTRLVPYSQVREEVLAGIRS